MSQGRSGAENTIRELRQSVAALTGERDHLSYALDATEKELAEAHTHFAIQEGRIKDAEKRAEEYREGMRRALLAAKEVRRGN